MNVCYKKVGVEAGFGSEGLVNIAVEIDGQEAAAVIGTKGDLPTGVCGYGFEPEVGIAVRD
jgi:hypothetical protein